MFPLLTKKTLLLGYIHNDKKQLPFIAFTSLYAAAGNVSLNPVTCEGVLLSQCTDEAVDIQRGQVTTKYWSPGWNTGLSELKTLAFYWFSTNQPCLLCDCGEVT